MFNLTFHGAAGTTTGSMHQIEVNGLTLLLDCGLFQGKRKEAFERNRQLGIDPKTIDYVLLSHAHIDHSGNLPTLARKQFRGRVLCTPATRDLCDILLRDSAILQGQDVERVNRKRAAQQKVLFEPLYVPADVDAILSRFETVPYHRSQNLGKGVRVTFWDAGHILGSAIVQIDAEANGQQRRLVFSGDLGPRVQPIIRPPEPAPDAQVILMESTYADRLHPAVQDVKGRLKGFIEDIHQQQSKLVVPAFSVGRTQRLIYALHELVKEGRIPPTPIIVDSPLATKATRVYARHRDNYDEDTLAHLREGDDPFRFEGLRFTESVEESKALNHTPGPMVIISASGMCEGGRILHHLRNTVGDPRNIILIVGYQAVNTLGRRIVERQSPLRIYGDEFNLQARVHTINALSAHADKAGLLAYYQAIGQKAERVFAVHGEPEKCAAMATLLRGAGAPQVDIPEAGQRFEKV